MANLEEDGDKSEGKFGSGGFPGEIPSDEDEGLVLKSNKVLASFAVELVHITLGAEQHLGYI